MSSLVRESTRVRVSTRRSPRTSWAPLLATAALTALAFGVSGFLFGTVQGDIPWPATQAEETVYSTARGLQWAGVAILLIGAIAVAISSPSRTSGGRWLWALVALIGSATLGGIIFLTAFGFAEANYLFAFTS